jgi:hypothetical protein
MVIRDGYFQRRMEDGGQWRAELAKMWAVFVVVLAALFLPFVLFVVLLHTVLP